MPVWWWRFRKAHLAAGALAALALCWLQAVRLPVRQPSLPAGAAVLLLPPALTFAGQHWLRHAGGRRRAVQGRLAFLLGAGVGAALWACQALAVPRGAPWWQLGAALLGAFAGGLAATALDDGLWEESYPPPRSVQEAVRRHHLRTIGRPPPGPRGKRLFDVTLAALGILLSAPLWLLCLFLVWFEDPGPVLFIKSSVGKGGQTFRQLKVRSMVRNAEAETGPVATSREGDPRVLAVGRWLRKMALDELPQLVNILRGEMSFVGPRPLRTVVIHEYLQGLPRFSERHRVQPGIAGLSQVRGGYYVTPRQRLRFDRLYVAHMSLRLDLSILLQAALIVLWLRWIRGTRREKLRRWVRLR